MWAGLTPRLSYPLFGTPGFRRGNSWAFFQPQQFVTYKAALAGVIVHLVPAAYTSQMYHGCLYIGSRTG